MHPSNLNLAVGKLAEQYACHPCHHSICRRHHQPARLGLHSDSQPLSLSSRIGSRDDSSDCSAVLASSFDRSNFGLAFDVQESLSAYTGSHFVKGAAAVAAGNRMVGPPSSWSRDQEESLGRLGQRTIRIAGVRSFRADDRSLPRASLRFLSASRLIAGISRLTTTRSQTVAPRPVGLCYLEARCSSRPQSLYWPFGCSKAARHGRRLSRGRPRPCLPARRTDVVVARDAQGARRSSASARPAD